MNHLGWIFIAMHSGIVFSLTNACSALHHHISYTWHQHNVSSVTSLLSGAHTRCLKILVMHCFIIHMYVNMMHLYHARDMELARTFHQKPTANHVKLKTECLCGVVFPACIAVVCYECTAHLAWLVWHTFRLSWAAVLSAVCRVWWEMCVSSGSAGVCVGWTILLCTVDKNKMTPRKIQWKCDSVWNHRRRVF